jgi:hypothetical protein
MAKNMSAQRQRERQEALLEQKLILMNDLAGQSDSVGVDSLKIGSNHIMAPMEGSRSVRCRRSSRLVTYIAVLLLMIPPCVAFRQDLIFGIRSNRNNLLQSQKNLIDDVQEGETSRLQRLLPSAWRNKNMSSWDMVESVRDLRGGGMTGVDDSLSFGVVPRRNATLPPPGALDKMVGNVLTFFGKAVVFQSVVTLLTSNDHALLTEVCACRSFFFNPQYLRLLQCH